MKKIVSIIAITLISLTGMTQNAVNIFLDLQEIVDMAQTKDTSKLMALGFDKVDNVWTNDSTGEYITFTAYGMMLEHKDATIIQGKNRKINADGVLLKQFNRYRNRFTRKDKVDNLGDAYVKHAHKKDHEIQMYVNWNTKLSVWKVYDKHYNY
jgi:hypothetical protein